MNQENDISIRINDEYYYYKKNSRRLGQGKFGDVYKCYSRHQTLKKLCVKVIKVYKQIIRVCDDKIMSLNEIKNEFRIGKQLEKFSRDNMIEILDEAYNETNKEYMIVMERCDKDLRQYIKEREQANDNFKPTEIISFIQQFVNGYKNLYEQQIIHRDIKPDNILVNVIGSQIQYKIADLGSSKIYTELHNSQPFGSPIYCAPEIKYWNQSDKSDVFSFGCTLYSFIYFNNFKSFQKGVPGQDIIDKYEENPILYFNDKQFNPVFDLLRDCLIRDPKKRISWPQIFQHPVMDSGIITRIKLVEDSLFIEQQKTVIMSQNIQRPKRWSNKPRDVRINRFLRLLKLKQMFILKINEDLNQIVDVQSQLFSTGLIALVTLYHRYEYGFISNDQTFIPLKKRKYFKVNYQEADFSLYFMLHRLKEKSKDLEKGRKLHMERIQYLQKKIDDIMNVQLRDYVDASLENLLKINDQTLAIFLQENLNRFKEFNKDLDIDDVLAYLKKIYNEQLQYVIEQLKLRTPQKQQIFDLVNKEIQVLLNDIENKYEQMKYNLINIPEKVEDMIYN